MYIKYTFMTFIYLGGKEKPFIFSIYVKRVNNNQNLGNLCLIVLTLNY